MEPSSLPSPRLRDEEDAEIERLEKETREIKADMARAHKMMDKIIEALEKNNELEEEVEGLTAELEALNHERNGLKLVAHEQLVLLRKLEWCCGDYSICPICDQEGEEGHRSDCELDNVLKGEE